MDTCERLAATGADQVLPLLAIGAFLLLAGVATVLVMRRKAAAWLGVVSLVALLAGGLAFSSPQTALAADCVTPTATATPTPTPTPTVLPGPTAVADTATISEDAAPNTKTGNVLTNDSSPAGYTLAVANSGSYTLTYGTLVINADGTFTYTLDNTNPTVNALNNGQTLTDAFSYTLSDGHGGSASATLTVTINGNTDAAVLTANADTANIREDTAPNPITGNVLTNDTDTNGYALSVANAGTVTLAYGVLVLHADGTFTYTLDNSNPVVNALNSGQRLTDTFTYTASNGHGVTASALLTITIDGNTDV